MSPLQKNFTQIGTDIKLLVHFRVQKTQYNITQHLQNSTLNYDSSLLLQYNTSLSDKIIK